jgi:hypothetical protein
MDNRSNSRANTCVKPRLYRRGAFIRFKPSALWAFTGSLGFLMASHNN